jgi:uncharacterized protein (UPF0333 family)
MTDRGHAMGRGQVSMEYMMIVGFSLLLIIPIIAIYGLERQGMNTQVAVEQASNIGRKVTDASETVYYLGKPAKTTLKIYMPAYIENITISDREIIFLVALDDGTTEVVATSDVNMTGSISAHQGIQFVEVAADDYAVNISSV